jgi:hypothetical protein
MLTPLNFSKKCEVKGRRGTSLIQQKEKDGFSKRES